MCECYSIASTAMEHLAKESLATVSMQHSDNNNASCLD